MPLAGDTELTIIKVVWAPGMSFGPHDHRMWAAIQPLAITYSRAYRLTRALLDPGPRRRHVRGRFTRLVGGLSSEDQHALRGNWRIPAEGSSGSSTLVP